MAFAAVTILMDTIHQHFLQPTPRFPLRNQTKVTLLYEHLSSLQTSLEQDFKVGECNKAIKALEAQMRDVSTELRFQIEHHLTLFYLGKSMKLRLHSAQKLLPILNGATKGGIETMDLDCVGKMLRNHFTLPVSGMPAHIKRRVESFCKKYAVIFKKDFEDVLRIGDEQKTKEETEDEEETKEESEDEEETKEETEDEQEESDDEWETEEEQKSDDEQGSEDEQEESDDERGSEDEESDDEQGSQDEESDGEQGSQDKHEESNDERWSEDEHEESDDEQGSEDEREESDDEWETEEEQKSDDKQETEVQQHILSEVESIIRQELRAPSYLNKYMKQRIQARHNIHQIFMEGIKLTSYIKKKVLKVKNAHYNESNTPQGNNTSASLTVDDSVGCDDEFNMIMDKLNQQSKQREIVSIVGMGGIGKTTLAKRIYGDVSFISRFDCRAWVTISQVYNPTKVLKALHRSLDDPAWVVCEDKNELAMRVDKCVKGKRYLIVLDDIWSTDVLDDLMRCFKDGMNGSRMLLTTRLKHVAEYADSCGNLCHTMRFLDSYESWNLFHNQVMPQRITLSPEFERIGREIVKKCKGLPLAIKVVAGLLSNPKQDLNEWKLIAKNVHKLSINHSNQQGENIIDLSYTFLPHHLKHCFLSIGCFQEDEELAEDFIVDLWVFQGFLKVLRSKSLDDVARESLKDLVDRNLLLISTKTGYSGSMNVYQMHDVLRELALREAPKENLLCLKNDRHIFNVGFRRTQRINSSPISHPWSIQSKICSYNSLSHTCSTFLSLSSYSQQFHYYKFLRGLVLGVLRTHDVYASKDFTGLVHLRYLKCGATSLELSSLPLFMLRNLQKLDVESWPSTHEPLNIWGFPQLKNLSVRAAITLVPPRSTHHNLESIRYLDHRSCTKELFMRIPNLRILGIVGEPYSSLHPNAFNWFKSLACLYKLEDLQFSGNLHHLMFSTIHSKGTLSIENFLPNLKRLKLLCTRLNWKNMYVVEMLPKLEVLFLADNAGVGGKWKPTDRGFPGLKFLTIEGCDLQIWKATSDHFPVLECLVLKGLWDLKRIPSDFADITTLKSIKLCECSKSAISSAKFIQEEKLDYGNDAFTVDILRTYDFDDSFWERSFC